MRHGRIVTVLVWLAVGAGCGIVADYYLYRIGLPMTPFVYQAF